MLSVFPAGIIAAVARWAIFNQDGAKVAIGAAFNVLILPADAAVFVHKATASNSLNNYTDMYYPLTNAKPNAIALVTPNNNPGAPIGVPDVPNNHPFGVWYNDIPKQWSIFNQDGVPILVNAAFNVYVPPTDSHVFVHTATQANSAGDYTNIDYPLTNNNPTAIVFVTPNLNPGNLGNGVLNKHPIGVWYNAAAKKWAIFNQDGASILNNAAFNVYVVAQRIWLPLQMR